MVVCSPRSARIKASDTSGLTDMQLANTPQLYLVPRVDIAMRVPDEVRQCVVFIGLPVPLKLGQFALAFKGTAFFVSMPSGIEGKQHVYLVTAKHVALALAGKQFLVRVNMKDGGSSLIGGQGVRWWTHPSDNSVDVAILPWAPSEQVEYKSIPSSMFLSDEVIKSKGIGTGDEVFITGLFAHLTGSKRNLPIVRIGNVAMLPDETIPAKGFGNIEAYLIEARSIGGLSGSPAFVRGSAPIGLGKFYLLGLMHGHWDIPPETKNDAILMDEDSIGKVNIGIAIVIPAKKILEVLNHPQLVELRMKGDEQAKQKNTPTEDKLKATTS